MRDIDRFDPLPLSFGPKVEREVPKITQAELLTMFEVFDWTPVEPQPVPELIEGARVAVGEFASFVLVDDEAFWSHQGE